MTDARPPHLRWSAIALVVAGGMAGSAARAGLALAIPTIAGVPIAIALVNIVGAFVLGGLYSMLAHRGPADASAAQLRLLIGTGFCGGFTTYSALANDTVVLAVNGGVGAAMLYALGTLLVGGLATWAGIVVGIGLGGRRRPGRVGESA
ncbi:CrcB protein [Agromyces cerinus]|uniref:fluoride efflux transporter FluC n=1 Tax=Agromyces cerinus TaxID=33878 RepID=UPI0027DB3411|nr:CrcB family protein [Agromyces cerinus]MBM7830524.1 CrcB protein [Agromyces cerinus]